MWTKMEHCGRSAELIALTKRMLHPEIEDRISAREILESPLFRKERPRAAPEMDDAVGHMQTLGLTRAAADTMIPQRAPAQQQQQQQQPRQMPDRREMHSAGRIRGGGEDGGGDVARRPDAAALEEVSIGRLVVRSLACSLVLALAISLASSLCVGVRVWVGVCTHIALGMPLVCI